MGKVERVTCMICGEEFDINETEPIFTGRTQYRCFGCINGGRKEINQRITASFVNGHAKKMKERKKWR